MKRKTYLAPITSVVGMEAEAIIAQSVTGSTSQGVDINFGGENTTSGLDADVRENGIWNSEW